MFESFLEDCKVWEKHPEEVFYREPDYFGCGKESRRETSEVCAIFCGNLRPICAIHRVVCFPIARDSTHDFANFARHLEIAF